MKDTDLFAPYRGLAVPHPEKPREQIVEDLLDMIIEASDICVPEEVVERETAYIYDCNRRDRRLVSMGGGPVDPFENTEPMKERIRADVVRDLKAERVIRHVIETEAIAVSSEELLSYAQTMAEKEHSTLELVRRFFGEDLSGLGSYVQKEKARALIYNSTQK